MVSLGPRQAEKASREEISALLRERQVSAGRMQRNPTVRDGGFNRRAVFVIAAASFSELPVDDLDRQPPGMVNAHNANAPKMTFRTATPPKKGYPTLAPRLS
jgi:hypothetical protein